MGTVRLLLVRFKNAASSSSRLFSSSAALIRRPWTYYVEESEESDGESAVYKRALKLQRPTTVKYHESLQNSVSLIGRIELPLKACNSSEFGVHTFLRGAYRNIRVMLTFWHEMAEMSVQHLKPNDLIYVSGRLGCYMKMDKDGKSMRNYKVDVKEVNFVSQHSPKLACQNPVKWEPEVSVEEMMQKRKIRLHLWQVFFANPYEWWDNRKCKLNSRAPDFKHKDTGEVLWLNDTDPPWVEKQLQLHDSRLSNRRPGEHRNAWLNLSPMFYDDLK